jgi:hypothetical protein
MVYPKSEKSPARKKKEKKMRKMGRGKDKRIESDESSLYS